MPHIKPPNFTGKDTRVAKEETEEALVLTNASSVSILRF
jgi:hypothetical protein